MVRLARRGWGVGAKSLDKARKGWKLGHCHMNETSYRRTLVSEQEIHSLDNGNG